MHPRRGARVGVPWVCAPRTVEVVVGRAVPDRRRFVPELRAPARQVDVALAKVEQLIVAQAPRLGAVRLGPELERLAVEFYGCDVGVLRFSGSCASARVVGLVF